MANIIKESKVNPYKLSNNKSNTPKKLLTLSSVKTVSPFKYEIKVFHFDQSHGIFRNRLNSINNVRHILFCERVPMRQNTHTLQRPTISINLNIGQAPALETTKYLTLLLDGPSSFPISRTLRQNNWRWSDFDTLWHQSLLRNTGLDLLFRPSPSSTLYRATTTERAGWLGLMTRLSAEIGSKPTT